MKRITLSFIFIHLLSIACYSQKIDNDTLNSKLFIKSNWAIRYEMGFSRLGTFNKDIEVIANSPAISLSLFFRNFSFGYGGFSYSTLITGRSIELDSWEYAYLNYPSPLPINTEIEITSMKLWLGYDYDLTKRFGFDSRLGFNLQGIGLSFNNVNTTINVYPGMTLGLGFNTYFNVGRFNYILVRFGADYQTPKGFNYYYDDNSYNVYSLFPKGTINYLVTFAYKGWFRKRGRD